MHDINIPYGKIKLPAEIGLLIRRKRKEIGVDQKKLSGFADVGVRYLSELERGKPTVELGRALKVLDRLGLDVWILPRGKSPDSNEKSRGGRNG